MPLPRSTRSLIGLTLLALAPACAGPLPASFTSPATGRAAATDLLTSYADRFTNVERAPRFESARQKLSRFALSPSGIYDDAAVWTSTAADGSRALEVEATTVGGQYQLTPRANAPIPDRLGDGRHTIRLARAADGVYQWATSVEHNVGRFHAAAGTDVFVAALARLEQPAATVRAELPTTFPRTSAVLGRLFSLDAVRTAPDVDGTTRVDLQISARPERLRAAGMPAFGSYVDKYVNGTRWALALEDGHGARWADLRSAGGKMELHLRLRDGQLQTLDGAPRAIPDDVLLRTDLSTKFLLFDVGAEQLVGDFTFVRTPRERGWSVRWRQPPHWHIPLGMRHLINGALNRPFSGTGMHSAFLLRDPASGAGGTLLVRQFDVTVQESTLVRWFGSIGARAMSDHSTAVETEENRLFADVFRALRADVDAAYTR